MTHSENVVAAAGHAPPPHPAPASAPASASKALAIVALVAGIVAFLAGLVPVIGIMLGVVGLGFGIVALLKGQSKAMTITGAALGAIAIVSSLIATILVGVFTAAIVDTAHRTASAAAEESMKAQAREDAAAENADDEDADQGTRDDPVPLGTVISSDDWDVVITSFTPNYDAEVALANTLNAAPAEGDSYAMIDVTATYTGAGEASSLVVGIDYVTSGGAVLSAWDSSVSGVEPRFGQASMHEGGVDSGKLVFLIPSANDGVLRVTPGILAGDVFVATS